MARIGSFAEDVKESRTGLHSSRAVRGSSGAVRRCARLPIEVAASRGDNHHTAQGGHLGPERVGVIGLGAIGGSIAWSATRAGLPQVVGFAAGGKDEAAAARAGAVTAIVSSPEDVVDQSDLIVLATPPRTNIQLLDRLKENIRQRAVVVTDTTSVQTPMLEQALKLALDAKVVASHPFFGTHETGFQAARLDMLDGAMVYVSANEGDDPSTRQVMDFWCLLGASPVLVDATLHDEAVAWTSHLPQVVSSALAVTLAHNAPSDAKFGSGARDTTRLAASSVEMWRDLIELNRGSLLKSVESFQRHLESLATALQHGDKDAIEHWLEKGADFRRNLSE